jgi:spermidine/putrescine transport system permease protein
VPGRFLGPIFVGPILFLLISPLLLIVFLSFSSDRHLARDKSGIPTLQWYRAIVSSDRVVSAWSSAIGVAVPVGLLGAFLGFLSALSWWAPHKRLGLVTVSVLMAQIPPTAYSLGLIHSLKAVDLETSSSLIPVIISHLLWVLPFCMITIMTSVSQISSGLIDAAFDLGASTRKVAYGIVFRLVWPSVISAVLVGFLLSLNEYVRTSYLSGSTQMLSEYIYGRMMSGSDPMVYALGASNVALALVVTLLIALSFWYTKRQMKKKSRLVG